jgi:hypothetical protein
MNVADNNTVIYRYKFTEDFMEELYKFSKIHQYDDRLDFKDAWKIWTDDNEDIIEDETRRLTNLGYDGDVLVKMFKSAKYYFRKKSTEKKDPAKRRSYINVDKELINAMDNHIERQNYNKDYQPKTAFLDFCKEHEELLKATMTNIYHQGMQDSDDIENKIKKTYKNRYFIFIKNR